MTAFRHTARTLRADYLRCAAGLAMTAGPIAALPVANGFAWPLGIAAAAFVAYGIQIAINHASPIAMDDTGIARRGPLPRRIAWAELRSLRLKYFSTRRDRRGGWMQLVLKGRQDSIRIESTLNGFEDIVRRAATAAGGAGLILETATLGNLEKLGVQSGEWQKSTDPDAGFVERQRP